MSQPFTPQDLERFAARLARLGAPSAASEASAIGDSKVEAALGALERSSGDTLDAVLGLDALLEGARDRLAPAEVATVLRRIVMAFGAASNNALRQGIRDRVLRFFEGSVKSLLRGERLDKVEPFVGRFVDAVRGSDLLSGHPLGRIVREVEAQVRETREAVAAAEDAKSADPRAKQADRLVRRLLGRGDVAAGIAVVRTLGLDVEARHTKLFARFESKLHSINLGVLQRFESALRIPDRAMRFDKRFEVLNSIFPDVAGESDSLGKFGWLLGLDITAGVSDGYDGALLGLEGLTFAAPSVAAGSGIPALGGVDLGSLGDLGAFRGAGLDLSSLGRSSPARRPLGLDPLGKPITKIGGGKGLSPMARMLGRSGGTSELPEIAALFGGKMIKLPAEAVRALQSRDRGRFERAVAHRMPAGVARAVLRNVRGGRAAHLGGGLFARSAPSASRLRAPGHLVAGFQGMALGGARQRGLTDLARMVRVGGGSGVGMVAGAVGAGIAHRAARLPSLPATGLRGFAGGAGLLSVAGLGARTGGVAPMAMAGLRLPRVGVAASTAPGFAQALQAAAASGNPAAVRALLAAPRLQASSSVGASAFGSVPSYAIASDAFGVPRLRTGLSVSASRMAAIDGFDLTGGTIVAGGAARLGALPGFGTSFRGSSAGVGMPSLRGAGGLPAAPRGSFAGGSPSAFGAARLPSIGGFPAGRASAGSGSLPRFAPLGALGAPSLGAMLLGQAGGSRPALVRDDFGIVRMTGGASAPRNLPTGDVRVLDLAGAGRTLALPALPFGHGGHRGALPAGLTAGSFAGQAARLVAPALALAGRSGMAPRSVPVGSFAGSTRSVAPRGAGSAIELRAPSLAAPAGIGFAGIASLPSLANMAPQAAVMAAGAAGFRLGRAAIAAPRATGFASLADLAQAGGAQAAPQAVGKYYAAVSSDKLAVGRMQGMQLASFASPAAARASARASVAAGFAPADFAPAGLARLAGSAAPVPTGARAEHWGVAFDAAGFAPTGRIGKAAHAAGRATQSGSQTFARVEHSIDRVRGTFSGARMTRGGAPFAQTGSFAAGTGARSSGQALGFAGGASASRQALAHGAAAAPGAQWLLPGVGAGSAGQSRGIAGSAGSAGQGLVAGFGAAPGAQRLAHGAGQAVAGSLGARPSLGRAVEASPGYVGAPAAPGRRGAAPRLAGVYSAPAGGFSQTLTAAAGSDVLGLAAAGSFGRRRAPSAVSRRYAMLGVDGGSTRSGAQDPQLAAFTTSAAQSLATGGGVDVAAARTTGAGVRGAGAQSSTGSVFGLVPKQVSGRYRDRFRLDGWLPPAPIVGDSGPLSLGLRPARVERAGLDLQVQHTFVQMRGRLSSVATEGAVPVDLTSQLTGRTRLVTQAARARRERGVEFALRNFEIPTAGLFWSRNESGHVEHREVPIRLQYQALEPKRVWGRVEGGGAQARYDVSRSSIVGGAAPQGRVSAPAGSVRQVPGSANMRMLNVHVASQFKPESTDVRWTGALGADVTASPGFRSRIAPSFHMGRLGPALGRDLDVSRANELLERNLDALREAKRLHRAGVRVPVGPAWRLQVQLVGAEEQGAGRPAGAAPARRPLGHRAGRLVGGGRRALGRSGRSSTGSIGGLLDLLGGRKPRQASGFAAEQALLRPGSTQAAPAVTVVSTPSTTPVGEQRGLTRDEASSRSQRPQLRGQGGGRGQEGPSRNATWVAPERERRDRQRPVDPMVTGIRSVDDEDVALYEAAGIQRRAATHWVADTQMQQGVPSGDRMPRVEGARKPAPPVPNITQLVYQIYNRLKRDLECDLERRAGGF